MNADSNSIIVCGGADSLAQREEIPLTDEDERAMLEELRTPLEKVYADEFERYLELFFRYLPKKPFHVRTRYGGGFVCQKGKKKTGEEYFRACYPASSPECLTMTGGGWLSRNIRRRTTGSH